MNRGVRIPRDPGLSLTALLTWPRRGMPAPFEGGRSHLFARGRMGLFVAIRALGLRAGDAVLLPAYLPGSAVAPFRWAGIRTVPYPVDPKRLQPHWPALEQAAAVGQTHALLLVHYFGFPSDIDGALEFCARHRLRLIEDCAHSFLTRVEGLPLGLHGDAAIYSLPKMLPLPDGGALRLKHYAALDGVRLRPRLDSPAPLLPLIAPQRGRSFAGERAASAPARDTQYPLETARGISVWSRRLLRAMDLEAVGAQRRRNYRHLAERLDGLARVQLLHPELPSAVCPQVLPLLVADARQRAERLEQLGIGAYAWPTLPPEFARLSSGARWLSEHLLALPIHQDLTEAHMDEVAALVRSVCADTTDAPALPEP